MYKCITWIKKLHYYLHNIWKKYLVVKIIHKKSIWVFKTLSHLEKRKNPFVGNAICSVLGGIFFMRKVRSERIASSYFVPRYVKDLRFYCIVLLPHGTMEYGTHSCGYGVLLDIVTTPLFHEDGLDCDTVCWCLLACVIHLEENFIETSEWKFDFIESYDWTVWDKIQQV